MATAPVVAVTIMLHGMGRRHRIMPLAHRHDAPATSALHDLTTSAEHADDLLPKEARFNMRDAMRAATEDFPSPPSTPSTNSMLRKGHGLDRVLPCPHPFHVPSPSRLDTCKHVRHAPTTCGEAARTLRKAAGGGGAGTCHLMRLLLRSRWARFA